MVWFKVDDGLHASHKVLRLPRSVRLPAIGLWTLAGAWSAHEELDGYVPDYILPELGATPRLVEALLACGLWQKGKDGSQFSNWAEYQPTRAEIEANREKERDRKRKYRAGGQTTESQRDTTRTDSGSPDTPSRPDPSRPDQLLTLGQSSTEVTASVDMTLIIDSVKRFCDRDCSQVDAYRIVGTVLQRASDSGTEVKHAAAYVMGSIQKEPEVFQKLLDDARGTVSGIQTPDQCKPHGYPTGTCPTCDLAVAS